MTVANDDPKSLAWWAMDKDAVLEWLQGAIMPMLPTQDEVASAPQYEGADAAFRVVLDLLAELREMDREDREKRGL